MPKYEYQFGIVVEADDSQKAFEKLDALMDLLKELDFEHDPEIEGPFDWKD